MTPPESRSEDGGEPNTAVLDEFIAKARRLKSLAQSLIDVDSADQGYAVPAAEVLDLLDDEEEAKVAPVRALGWSDERLTDAVVAILAAEGPDDDSAFDEFLDSLAESHGMTRAALDLVEDLARELDRVYVARYLDSWSWYTDRLADPGWVDPGRSPRLATVGGYIPVPVGPGRRGGYEQFGGPRGAAAAMRVLAGLDGFPDLRVTEDEGGWTVRWGEDEQPLPPDDDGEGPDEPWAASDVDAGRLYGYSDAAIRAFLRDFRGFPPEVIEAVMTDPEVGR